jgi:hypothetical protein
MKPDALEKHISSTYFTLRIGIAFIAILFPFILWIGGNLYSGLPLQDSMSAYYHANIGHGSMRDWFVGILFAVGVFLYLYKGYSSAENIALNVAGVLVVGIAIFPMKWNCVADCRKFSVHGFFAVSFFLCIAYVCIRCASDTLSLIPDEELKRRFNRAYKLIGMVMISSPAIAFIFSALLQKFSALTFYVELVGVLAFATYWLTKSRELSITGAERLALQGKLET